MSDTTNVTLVDLGRLRAEADLELTRAKAEFLRAKADRWRAVAEGIRFGIAQGASREKEEA